MEWRIIGHVSRKNEWWCNFNENVGANNGTHKY